MNLKIPRHLKRVATLPCVEILIWYHGVGFDRFFWRIFSACCVYPNSLCVIRCLHPEIAIIVSEIVVAPMICGAEQSWAQYSWLQYLGHNSATSLAYIKVQDVSDFM